MTDIIHQWLHAVTFTGIVCSLAYMLTPEGRVKRAMQIICGIVMCIAIISPLAKLDMNSYSKALSQYKIDAESIARNGEEYSKNLNRAIIQERCEAYILDKAAEQGVKLSEVSVLARWSDEGYWYPYEAQICADVPQSAQARLSDTIEATLGISCERQIWNGDAS